MEPTHDVQVELVLPVRDAAGEPSLQDEITSPALGGAYSSFQSKY